VERRFSAGLTVLASYTWSKTISDVGCVANETRRTCGMQNPIDRAAERALSEQHIGQRFVASYLLSLPFGKGRRWGSSWSGVADTILGGWNLTGVATLTSGLPFSLSVEGNPSNSSGTDRPNVIGNPKLAKRTIEQWFNTAAFVPNDPFTFGNVGRDTQTGPPFYNIDFATLKDFLITERVKLQFRFEAFNFFNTPHFDLPGSTVGTDDFGVISSAGRPRNLQFGLKVVF